MTWVNRQKKLGRGVVGKGYQPYAGPLPTLSCPRRRRRRRRKRLESVFIQCKKSAVGNPTFSFFRKAYEEIKMLMNIEMLQSDLKKCRKDSCRELFSPRVQNGGKTVQNCEKFFTITK
jgi:hypothetical protein